MGNFGTAPGALHEGVIVTDTSKSHADHGLRVLHVLRGCYLPRDPNADAISGLVRAVLEISAAQSRLGHHVTVTIDSDAPWESEWSGVRLKGLRRARRAHFRAAGRSVDLSAHAPLIIESWRRHYDVVHAHSVGYLRWVRAGVRVIHFHSDPKFTGPRAEGYQLDARDLEAIARFSDVRVAVSQFVADELDSIRPGLARPRVVRNGVNTPAAQSPADRALLRRAWGAGSDDSVFLYAGMVAPFKGIPELLQAFARLSATDARSRLVIAGSENLWGRDRRLGAPSGLEHELQRFADTPSASGRVTFLGFVPAAIMPAIYAACDAVVVPSTWREGFGLVALEAMAASRPVIASHIGGLPEVVTPDCGVLVPPGDVGALSAAMRLVAQDRDLRRRLGSRGADLARRWSWDETARALSDIYSTAPRRSVRRQS